MDDPMCKDCGLTLRSFGLDHHLEDHPWLCCDCFDEKLGMPESSRFRPRPAKEGA